MSTPMQFGEHVEVYAVPVLNERVVRASAGILFMWAMSDVEAVLASRVK
jgi:hypothetical protein